MNMSAITIVATGPLTSDALSHEIARLSPVQKHLYFIMIQSAPLLRPICFDMSLVCTLLHATAKVAPTISIVLFTKDEYDRFYDALDGLPIQWKGTAGRA